VPKNHEPTIELSPNKRRFPSGLSAHLFAQLFSSTPSRAASLVCLLGCLGVLLAYVWPMLENFSYMQNDQDWFQFGAIYESFRHSILTYGQFPLRSPYFEGGYPMVGFPYDISLSPFAPLFLIFGSTPGMKLMMLLSFFIGTCGFFYLLLRALKFNLASATFGTLIFTLSGWLPMQVENANVPLLIAPYLAIWPVAFFIRALEKPKYVFAGALALYPLLATSFQSVIPLAVFMGVLSILFCLTGTKANAAFSFSIRPLIVLVVMGVLAGLYAAPKILPVIDFDKRLVDYIHIENERDYSVASKTMVQHYGVYPPRDLAQSILTRTQGQPVDNISIYYLYAGILPVLLGFAGMILVGRKSLRFSILFLFFIGFIIGPHSPVDVHQLSWYLFFPVQYIWKVTKYFSPYIAICLALWSAVFFEALPRFKRHKTAALAVFAVVIIIAIADPLTNNRYLFKGFYTMPPPPKAQLSPEPYGQIWVRDIPPQRFRNLDSMTKKERYFEQYTYLYLFKNIGTINWPASMLMYRGGIIPKFFAPSHETMQYDALPISKLEPNPEYRGEAYFAPESTSQCSIEKFTPNNIRVHASVSDPHPLIINQNFHDHWRASVGTVFDANGALGVRLPLGEHAVELRFVHRPFTMGLVIALLSAMGSVIIFRRMKKRENA
jgi:hypothetical protein